MTRRALGGAALAAAGVLLVTFGAAVQPAIFPRADTIGGPFARILAASTDLGPARLDRVRLTASLHTATEPIRLTAWARGNGLSVRWRPDDTWAVIEGPAAAVADAFGVAIRDYRLRDDRLRDKADHVFYASPQQPAVPPPTRPEVSAVGRILSYTPTREALPTVPRDVPDGGLLPTQLLKAYNATPLVRDGYTGKGQTVVVFAFDGFLQSDMDAFASTFGLPPLTPEIVGGMPERRIGEANMDLQVLHALAPEAKLVLVNARSTTNNEGGRAFEKLGKLMESVDRQFPGAVWSLSIGWGCDRLFTAADLAPVRAALSTAWRNATTAFNASGDLAGLECKGGHNWADPPSPDDVGVDAVGSLPEMTSVGGTKLSTAADGEWLAEQSWYDVPLIQGTGGGVSTLFPRPTWQSVDAAGPLPDQRLVPDVAAVADPNTGVRIVFNDNVVVGGGTSQSAPIWAGLTALMNQKLLDSGAEPLGEFNPLLYRIAQGSALPGFRDISLGGNAVSPGTAGYDVVTGLGTPNVENLVKNILLARAGG
jgi:kumamolisin